MRPFEPLDLYRTDELLTEEERLVRDTVREFVTGRVLPVIEEHVRRGEFPRHLVPEMAALGIFGANLHGYGCAGVSHTAWGLICQELERGDSGIRSFVSVQGSLVMFPIHAYGSDEQKERWLPALASGKAIGCFGLTESDHGSNPAGMRTRARKDGRDWVVDGEKMWITNGTIADLALIWARCDDGKIRGFLVERGTPGFSARPIVNKFSLRASDTSQLFFEGCRLPAGAALPGVEGLRGPLSCLTQARYGIAWGAVGSAMACFDEALRYSGTRIQFDRPIASFQLVQRELADMATEITLGQLLCHRLGRLKEAGNADEARVSLAKRNNVAMALSVARRSRDILGAAGICDDYQVARHLCNLESVITYEGTHGIHTLILGAHLTGLRAYT